MVELKRPVYEIGLSPGGGWVVIEHIPEDEIERVLDDFDSDASPPGAPFQARQSVRVHGPFEAWKSADGWIRRRHQEVAQDLAPGELERDADRRERAALKMGRCARDLGTALDAVRRVLLALYAEPELDLPGLRLRRTGLEQAHLELDAATLAFSNEADAARRSD